MPSFDKLNESPKKGKTIKSAFDSESFEADGTIHVDGLVGSATISPSGRDIALASPDGLAIIDLDSPYNPPRRLRSHGMPWLVVDVQWSPFAARDYWVVSTANHRALVWNLNMREDSSSGAIEHSLEGHSRAITDINFSAHHPDQLATCSVDGYVHCWDLRRPRQPVLTFCDWFAGASQVKYNRQNPHVLASAHDRWLHIWDERRVSEPLKTIDAHTSKIYGIDWNRIKPTGIVTCSLDKSIKMWDYEKNVEQPERIIRTEYPVWRARNTPFGWGLLAMPQNEPGELHLYDRRWPEDTPVEIPSDPVAVFPGHGHHKAKEFLWRSRGDITDDGVDNREFQLVSWGTDNQLRLHCVDHTLLSAVGHKKGGSARKGFNLTRKGATYKTFRTVDDASTRDKSSGTMSDPRPGSGKSNYQTSALTLGMRTSTSQRHPASHAWKGPSMRAKCSSHHELDPSQAQIGWMKGISMTKRKHSTHASRRHGSGDAAIFGPGYQEDGWGEPDTIQEELLRINNSLPKVKWEDINIDHLTLKASLNGPWGVDGETIFIKVKIDLPTQYPKSKTPKFSIEKTSFMPEETHKRIEREIHQLANQFLERKQNCLEVAFTYLLGEVDLETSTTFFKNVRDLDDDLEGLPDESSSDDDEDIPAGGSASMSQELPPHGDIDTALATPTRTIIPPPPRTCGARFSPDGRLVCFFPSKEEKAKALFSNSGDLYKDRAKGEPFFAGFGRVTYDLPPRRKFPTEDFSGSEADSDSDESETSSSSSSDSESISAHKLSLWHHPNRQLRKTWSEDRSVRSSGGGTGTGIGTGTGTGTSRRRLGRPRNIISIHDLGGELPSKRVLAKEYAIFGDGEDVCEHNARIADKHNCNDLANVWRYLALLLKTGVPLEILAGNQRRNSILVIAKDVVEKCGGLHDSTAALSRHGNSLAGRVKWGEHPLAKSFVQDLFDYYEKIADLQMLAMLACIFSESFAEDSVAYVESQLPQPVTPLPMKAPSFSLDYFPTDASAWNLYGRSHTTSAVTTPGTIGLHTPIQYGGSHVSDEGAWTGDPGSSSYSCGETPPLKGGKGFSGEAGALLSRSPTSRGVARSNTGIASTFAANLPRTFTGNMSSSPPVPVKKKPSPAEIILNSFAPNSTSGILGSSAGVGDSSGGRTSISDDDSYGEDMVSLVPVDVSVVVEDQSIFDDDGWMSTPLLEQDRAQLYANYRYAYAEMLQMWEQPLARLEILKFNVLREDEPAGSLADGSFHDSVTIRDGGTHRRTMHRKTGSAPIVMGRKDQLQGLLASGRGLDVTGICRIHETQLDAIRYTTSDSKVGGAVGVCDRCRRSQTQIRCFYCLEPVIALYPPCLSCGCASHEDCLAEWHAAGETLCPAGDECNCVEEAANGQVESWAALQGAMLKGQNQLSAILQSPTDGMTSDDEDEERAGRGGGGGGRGSGGWERVDKNLPSRVQGFAQSTAGLTLGRFRKTTGTWSRASSQKRGR